MPRTLWVCTTTLTLALASCHRGKPEPEPGSSAPLQQRPFSAFVTQRIVVTPAGFVRGGDTLGWVQSLGGPRAAARQLDSAILAAFDARGLAARWVMPAALQRTFERNRSYATDPYQLGLEPLRAAKFETASRYGEPLSSQLRTMVALEADARFVLLPVELRFERDGARMRGVLRVVFADPRLGEARWVGDVKGEAVSAAPAALASVAQKLADLFVAP